VDGMSNKYWGWGLEDDEFFVRYQCLIIFRRKPVLSISVADPDPGSGAFLTPGSGVGKKLKIRIRDPG
jgi:hypothetical protein